MHKQRLLIILAVFCSLLFAMTAQAQLPQISSGLSYLSSSQNPDGTWQSSTSQVETTAATVSVLETLKLLNQAAETSYTSGSSWLQGQTPKTVDYIAERVHALSLTDGSVNELIPALDVLKGAWGGYGGFVTNPLDTALALQALKTANYSDLTVINNALSYLTGNQNPDGGWGFKPGSDSNVFITAIVSATLQQFPQMTAIATAVNKATTYLLTHQNADGSFGSVYETALAYSALVAVSTDNAALGNAVNYLATTQSANGSWNDDPYSTALALKALYLSENKPAPPPPPPAGGKITGTVIDKVTGQKVAGVAVVLDSNNLINTTTDSSGNFTLSDIPAGAQKVNFSYSGYAATNATATVVVDTTANLGTIPMTSAATTGTIAGTITDATGKPLTGIAIIVSGAWSGSTTTGADGTYSFTYVTPGSVTISAAKTGFQTVIAPGSVYARTTLTFSPRMSATASQVTTGTLVGRVVDSYWGVAIGHLPEETGVQVIVSGAAPLAIEPEGGGYFTIPNLAPGTYQVIVGMHGFAHHTFQVVITPGGTTDLGTIRLDMSFLMTLTGTITDASTGAPLSGAEVTIQGKDFTGRTDSFGTYAIADIPPYVQYVIKAAAPGYIGKSYTFGAKPWLQTMDIALSPQVTKGSLTGSVIDAATGLPLGDVALTLVNDPTVTVTTDSSGAFTLNAVPQGPQQIAIVLSGYSTRTLTTAIIAGAVNNVGELPLAMTELPAVIQGLVRDSVANAPFANVAIQVTGTVPLQTTTAADGFYKLDNVTPGTITVSAVALSKPGYYGARITAPIEPGGILIFNPALSTVLSGSVNATVQTDKAAYLKGETAAISVSLQNRQTIETTTVIYLRVIDPNGTIVYDATATQDLTADGLSARNFSFVLPVEVMGGTYKILADLYDINGKMISAATKNFGVTVSQIEVTSLLPAVFVAGNNVLSFNLINSGTLAVSTGTLGLTLKDPDGQIVSTTTQNFNLALGENKTLVVPLTIPPLKFGSYTLTYIQNDETKTGQATEIVLPNDLAVTALYDDSSHRIRGMANLTVTLRNTGRFNLDTDSTSQTVSVTAAVPDAAYTETKPLNPAPTAGNASGSSLLYQFNIPETMTPGQHGTRITVSLPSGSTTAQSAQLAIMESSLSLSPVQKTFTAGDSIRPVFVNSGGVDTQVQYRLNLFDAKSALVAESINSGTVVAGSSLSPVFAIPTGAVDGNYNLMITYKDTKTGKEAMVPNAVTIVGVKGSLQVQTDKQSYLLTESVAGLGSMISNGTPLTGGNLHLQVTTGSGTQKTKTWTSQVDFRTGVRSGVDTYGVNDWIVPDDDFNGAALDVYKWNPYGSITILSGKAFVDSSVSGSGLQSKWKLEGDFDIQVDYDTNKSVGNQGPHLVVFGTNFTATIHNTLLTGDSSDIRVDGSQYYSDNKVYRNAGKHRITRVANTLTTYYWNGSAWINLKQVTSVNLNTPCSVSLQVWRNTTGYTTGASAFYDNFKINSGRIKTETQIVDSVRLLPLNDNFDDGVLNEDRWQKSGTITPVESAGTLHLRSDATSSENGVDLRSRLPGDFRALSKFRKYSASPNGVDNGRYIMSAGSGDSRFYINRYSNVLSQSTGQYLAGLSDVNQQSLGGAEIPYANDAGIFRLRREGNIGFDDYWDGAKWITIHSRSGIASDSASVSLHTLSEMNKPAIMVDLDSFYTEGGVYAVNGTMNLKHDSGATGGVWGKLLYSSAQPIGTSITFRTRTADSEAALATAAWSDYLTSSGSAVTSAAARWIEIESTLATTNTNVTPLLHDVSVTYESNPGEVLWQSDVPANLTQGAVDQLNRTIGTIGMSGKFYLEGKLTSSTGQSVASAEYPFYVEQGSIQIHLAPDKKIYRPGEAVTITGEIKNLSSVDTIGLTTQVQGMGIASPYVETFDLSASSTHPFNVSTIAGSDGVYRFTGSVTQNAAPLANSTGQFEVATPVVTAVLTAPEAVGNIPFDISVLLTNSGKVAATISVHIIDDGSNMIGDQVVTMDAGETRVLNFTQQIAGATTYTAVVSGDLTLTMTKKVAYTVVATDSSVSSDISTDKASYNPNEPVTLNTTISTSTARENLTTLITVTNNQGQAVYSETATIPYLVQGQTVTSRNYWNSGTYPAGVYAATIQVVNSVGSAIGKATCTLNINSPTSAIAILKGTLALDKQSILTGETVTVSYHVTNTGNIDLANIPLSIRTVNMAEQTVYNSITDQVNLSMGATATSSGRIGTDNYSAKDYLVVLRATIGGVEETLAGSYFRVEGAPSAPALIGPVNNSDVETHTPVLTVSNAADSNDDKLIYEFEVYSDSSLTNLATSGTVSETSGATSWTVAAPLTENQTCFWRTRAYDGRLYGPWMSPASFRVNTVNDPPAAPAVSSPSEGTSVATLSPILTVTNASDPDSTNLTYNFELALDLEFTQVVASTTGVAGGQGTTSWTVPSNLQENSWYYWRAQADDWLTEGAWSTTARFLVNTANDTPTAPVVTSPVNGATVTALATDVIVTNSSDPDSTSLLYYFEVDTVPTFDSTGIIRSSGVTEGNGTTLWHLSGLADNTRYYLRVKSNDGSADSPWSIVVEFGANTVNDPPTTPPLANPSNGAGVSVFTPTLSVHNSTDLDKDALVYEFELYADAALTNMIAQSGPVAETASITAWTTPVALSENQTCYWRARASDGSQYSGWMPTASFMVNTANDAPGVPGLSAPADGSTISTLTPTLEIINAVDQDSASLTYDFEVYSNNLLITSRTSVPAGASGKTSVAPGTALTDNTAYTWRARAFDGDRYGQWMNMATFTTHIAQATIRAEIEFEPETLNKNSEGKWAKVEIELPHGYKVSDIDISSIRLEGTVAAEYLPHDAHGKSHDGCDHDRSRHDHSELTVKFKRSDIIAVLPEGKHVPVHVTGKVGASLFGGIDIIRVIK